MNELPSVLSVAVLAALALAVGVLMNILKPYLELIPGVRPSDPNHDATIRLVTLLLTVASAVGYAQATGVLTSGSIVFLLLQVVLQYGASLGLYHSYNPTPSGIGTATPSEPTPAPAPATLPAQPVAQVAPVAALDQARLAALQAEVQQAVQDAIKTEQQKQNLAARQASGITSGFRFKTA